MLQTFICSETLDDSYLLAALCRFLNNACSQSHVMHMVSLSTAKRKVSFFFSTSIHWIPHKDIIHENRNYTVVFTRFSQSCTSQTIGATAQQNTCSLERHLIEVARSTVLQELAAVGSSTNFRITLYPVKPLRCHWIFPVSIETSAELSGMHASSGTLPLVPPEFSGGRKTLLQPDALSSDVDVFHAPKLSGDSGAAESYVLHLFLRCLRSSTRVTRCTL